MRIETFLTSDITTLSETDRVFEAIQKMNDYKVISLPYVVDNVVKTLVTEDELLSYDEQTLLADLVLEDIYIPSTITLHNHPYEAASKMMAFKSDLLPVVNDDGKYIGVITKSDLFSLFVEHTGLSQNGGIIILSVKLSDYSLSEIARICESCNVVPLNVQTHFENNIDYIDVIVKINTSNLQILKSTFERFNYIVTETYGELPFEEDLKDRYNLLMNYINM